MKNERERAGAVRLIGLLYAVLMTLMFVTKAYAAVIGLGFFGLMLALADIVAVLGKMNRGG